MPMRSAFRPRALALLLLLAIGAEAVGAQTQLQPLPALLPDKTTLPPGDPMPIDGMWRIDAVSARVRIEGGRIFALDPWVHLLVWKVLPGMVVTKDLKRTGPGIYEGDDLPNLGPWKGTLNGNQQLEVHIQGQLAPIDLVLTALQPDDPAALRRERAAQEVAAP